MTVQFFNYTYAKHAEKHIYCPSEECRDLGDELIREVRSRVKFPNIYRHIYSSGGHVAAMHAHAQDTFFCKVDLKNFYYQISRNRVATSLAKLGISDHVNKAKWSCIKNPFGSPKYSLAYGFVQSPILSSLVMMHSDLEKF